MPPTIVNCFGSFALVSRDVTMQNHHWVYALEQGSEPFFLGKIEPEDDYATRLNYSIAANQERELRFWF